MELEHQPGGEPRKRADADRVLALYRERDPRWTENISVRQFFNETPSLATGAPPPAATATWIRWLPNAIIALACAALLVFGDWRFEQLFARNDVSREVPLTGALATLSSRSTPAVCREHVSRINDSLKRADWLGALEQAEELAATDGLREAMNANATARDWLRALLVVAPVKAAAKASGASQLALYDRALRNHSRHGPWEDAGFEARLAVLLARFHQQGGPFPTPKIGAAERVSAERLASEVGEFRNRFGADIAGDETAAKQLLVIEGYSIARRLTEGGVKQRFDAGTRENQSRWRRLDELLREAKTQRGLANDRDVLALELFFWETAETFTWPNGFDDRVSIGGWSALESEIDGHVLRLRQRLGVVR